MTTETAQTKALLLELIGAFISFPESLRIVAQESETGDVYWIVKGEPEDDPKLIGRGGEHVQALTLIVREIGLALGKIYTLRLLTESAPRDREPQPFKDTLEYNPLPARTLLERVIESLNVGKFAVAVGPGAGPRTSLSYVFAVRFEEVADSLALTRGLGMKFGEREVFTTLEYAIGVIFRAIAKQAGVRFHLVIEKS